MRRGGRGSGEPAPRTGHDHAIASALHSVDRSWAARRYVRVLVLAASSVAIAIIIWSLRAGLPQGPSRPLGHNLQARNGGFVVPLYHYYQQYPNGSRVVGGRRRWRGSRGGIGRGIRSDAFQGTFFDLRGGHFEYESEMEQFYVEMKLGDPATPFYFDIDTGSGPTWVYCTDRGQPPSIKHFGPHGLFDPPKGSYANCTGSTATLCRAFQAWPVKCDTGNSFECIFSAIYVDGSERAGLVVNGSITLPMRDKSESKVFGLFGCVVEKEGEMFETLPLVTDGIIGLGNCPGTLLAQLSTSKTVSQNVLGICLANNAPRSRATLPAAHVVPVGYVSLGTGFDQKFDQRNSAWAKLIELSPRIPCGYAIKLLSVTIGNRRVSVHSKSLEQRTAGMPLGLDTGSDFIFLDYTLYDRVLRTLETYTTAEKYFRIADNDYDPPSEQRVCWEYRAGKRQRTGDRRTKASPIRDFVPMELGFEGIGSGKGLAPNIQYLIIQPKNYLTWAEDEMKVCVNILQDYSDYSISNIGSQAMREHQFLFDIENQRVRWESNSNCEI